MSIEEKIKELILNWDETGLKEFCRTSIDNNEASPESIIKIIGEVMKLVGIKFEKEEYYVPELIMASNVVKATMGEVIDPAIKKLGMDERKTKGKVVIGTVEGDIHSIGKDLVGSFLFSNGFEVFNLGVDVSAQMFIEKAEEVGAQIIGLSALITMSMDAQRQVIEELKSRGIREKYKVIVGGSPTSEDWAEQIGADGWADDAIEAVSLAKKLLNIQD
ncbi:MAG: cobalamin B12-binding domain-containing protein [Candidatus Helarchaeota archaeon]|nr:cobalamin B12-binding domain-containing protein [Candidatus Helarchaeota archaeon]